MEVTVETKTNQLAAGGDNPAQFQMQEAWYPVHYLKDLDRTKPTPFTLLGQNIVIWWEESSQSWRVLEDKCPHRLVPLSEGRINNEGRLECPYHGWAFSGSGKCEVIPQQVEGGKAETSQRACVKSLPTAEAQGLLFVYPGQPENAQLTKIPIVELLEESPQEWICLNTFRDLPYDAFTLLENVLDPSHIPYTHHGTVGNRANVSPVELEVVASGKQGFTGVWQEGPRRGTLGKQDTTFIAPGLMYHDLTSKQFGRTVTVVYATPTEKGKCRLFARFPFKFASKFPAFFIKLTPEWYNHTNQNRILEDDQIFLHHQELYLETAGGSQKFTQAFYLPTKADKFVFEFRQWIHQYQVDPFPGKSLPPVLTKEQLLDRYHSHTVNCASCRNALKNIQRLRKGAVVSLILLWTIIPLLAVTVTQISGLVLGILTTAILAITASWFGLGKLEKRFYQGEAIPPRNLVS